MLARMRILPTALTLAGALLAASTREIPIPPAPAVVPVPNEVRARFELAPSYAKAVLIDGFPVVGSEKVADHALLEAAYLIHQVTLLRPELRRALADANVRFAVMAYDERTTDVPEHSDLTPALYWDRRARGLGATAARPAVSCGEENLLGFPGDPYATENILIHELAHAVHEMALARLDPSFDARLKVTYESALAEGLWKGTYAATNKEEYWAEAAQSWFDTNREDDDVHNHVNTRAELRAYDARLAKLCAEVFGEGAWRYQRPREREQRGHLKGFDPRSAPTFEWSAAERAQSLERPDEAR